LIPRLLVTCNTINVLHTRWDIPALLRSSMPEDGLQRFPTSSTWSLCLSESLVVSMRGRLQTKHTDTRSVCCHIPTSYASSRLQPLSSYYSLLLLEIAMLIATSLQLRPSGPNTLISRIAILPVGSDPSSLSDHVLI
jgi:hypothetical protein